MYMEHPRWLSGKSICNAEAQEAGFSPWVRKALSRKWLPDPMFLPERPHGERSLRWATLHGVQRVRHTEQLSTQAYMRLSYVYSVSIYPMPDGVKYYAQHRGCHDGQDTIHCRELQFNVASVASDVRINCSENSGYRR